jgi:hypothetical protein
MDVVTKPSEVARLIEDAEQRIQRILWELERDTGRAVDEVEVDTRNYAQLRTEITLRGNARP